MDNVTVDLEAVIAGNRSSLLMPSDSDLSVNYTKLEEQDTLEGLSQRRLSDQSRRLSDEVDKFFDESPPNLRGKNRVNRMRESLALFKRLNDGNIGIQLWEDVTINSDEDFDDTGIIHEVTKVVNAFKSQKGDCLSSANKENAISAKKDIVEEIMSALEEWTKALGLPKADDRIASLPATGVSGKDPVEECVQLLEDIKITIEKPLIFTKRRPSESEDPEDYNHKPVVSKKEWTRNVTLVLNSDETSDSPAISSAIVKVPCKSSQEISCKTPQETPCKPLQEIPCKIPQETPCKIPRETPCMIPQTRSDLNGVKNHVKAKHKLLMQPTQDITLSYQTPQRRLLNEHTVTRVEDISNVGTNRRWTRLNDKTLEQMASLTYAFRTRAQKTKDVSQSVSQPGPTYNNTKKSYTVRIKSPSRSPESRLQTTSRKASRETVGEIYKFKSAKPVQTEKEATKHIERQPLQAWSNSLNKTNSHATPQQKRLTLAGRNTLNPLTTKIDQNPQSRRSTMTTLQPKSIPSLRTPGTGFSNRSSIANQSATTNARFTARRIKARRTGAMSRFESPAKFTRSRNLPTATSSTATLETPASIVSNSRSTMKSSRLTARFGNNAWR